MPTEISINEKQNVTEHNMFKPFWYIQRFQPRFYLTVFMLLCMHPLIIRVFFTFCQNPIPGHNGSCPFPLICLCPLFVRHFWSQDDIKLDGPSFYLYLSGGKKTAENSPQSVINKGTLFVILNTNCFKVKHHQLQLLDL